MSAVAGRNARLLANITSGGTAEPIAFLSQWSLDMKRDRFDVTSFGDKNVKKVAGLPATTGSYSGFLDLATPQMYAAASDGVERKVYLYPDYTNTPSVFWQGLATFDMSVSADVNGVVGISGSFEGAGDWVKVG